MISKRLISIDFYQNRILEKYASKDPIPITLRQLTSFGRNVTTAEKLLQSGNYIRQELPVRLAHRIRMFQQLPYVIGTNPHISQVYDLYWQAFESFRLYKELKDLEDNAQFCEFVQGMLQIHSKVVPLLVLGIQESRKYMENQDLNKFMNETLQSRLSRRVLAEQHLALTRDFKNPKNTMIGIVDSKCRALEVVNSAIKNTNSLFINTYNALPPTVKVDGDLSCSFTYIPGHVEYILFELLKNSMRYTFEKHGKTMPPIRVTIGSAEDKIMFRVSDVGGGIRKRNIGDLWKFVKEQDLSDLKAKIETILESETSIPVNGIDYKLSSVIQSSQFPMDLSLGIGIPMSRVYANYWGGGMSVYSMDGYGTDAYVTISIANSFENLKFDKE